MGAAAVAARLGRRGSEGKASDAGTGLAFDRPGGPLVAVCGLAGGAGTSTLAHALAERAAQESAAPVLLCEADPTAGALAALAGAATAQSFSELALHVAAGRAPEAPFAVLPSGLRLIASVPRRRALPGAAALAVLRDARAAHGLTVVDCGTVARLEALPALELASHILWVMPATPSGLARARLAFGALAPRPGGRRETLVAVATTPARAVRTRDLRELAETRADLLLLIPHTPALIENAGATPAVELAATLADLATVLRGPGR